MVAGGAYLLYLAVSHFLAKSSQDEAEAQVKRFGSGFWGTVISVELADIAFSIDSILAAVAMANDLPSRVGDNGKAAIVVTGGILGIITMRYVAGYFIILLERFRGMEPAAYGLVAWIGLKLVSSGLHKADYLTTEMNPWLFWIGMLTIVVMGLLYQPRTPPPPEETVELVRRITGLSNGDGTDSDESSQDGTPGQAPTAEVPARPG
jgi:YkoY family integral membrane protein